MDMKLFVHNSSFFVLRLAHFSRFAFVYPVIIDRPIPLLQIPFLKVKFALEQAMNAQRGSRGVAVPFL
jgi:hypothetical protein